MTSDGGCGFRWRGPRADVPEAYANHVCALPPHYHPNEGPHRCACGAELRA